jgi:HlyD family secretion protein
MNTKIRLSVAIVVVLGSAVGVYVWWGQREAGRSNPLVLYGNVDIREVAVAFRQPGRLMKSVFEEGDTVRTGQVMADIDPQFYSDALAGADADVQQARAELQRLRNGNRPPDIKRAEEAVREAEAAYQKADSDFRRQAFSLRTELQARERWTQ